MSRYHGDRLLNKEESLHEFLELRTLHSDILISRLPSPRKCLKSFTSMAERGGSKGSRDWNSCCLSSRDPLQCHTILMPS